MKKTKAEKSIKEEKEMAQATFGAQEAHTDSFKLISGHKIPAVGLGTWKAGSAASDSVFTAIVEVQIRLFLNNRTAFLIVCYGLIYCLLLSEGKLN